MYSLTQAIGSFNVTKKRHSITAQPKYIGQWFVENKINIRLTS